MSAQSQSSAPAARHAEQHQVMDDIRRLVQFLRVATVKSERDLGMSAAQLFVLQTIAESPATSVNDVAAHTRTHQSSVSVVVTKLVDRGLVDRKISPQDARRVELSITPAGRRALKDAPPAVQQQMLAALNTMPPTDLHRLADSLRQFTHLLGLNSHPPMFFEPEPTPTPKRKPPKSPTRPRTR